MEGLLGQRQRPPHQLRLRAVRSPRQRLGRAAQRRPQAAAHDEERPAGRSHQRNAPASRHRHRQGWRASAAPTQRCTPRAAATCRGRPGLQPATREQRKRLRIGRILRLIRPADRLRRAGNVARTPSGRIGLRTGPLLHAVAEKVQRRIPSSLRRL